MLAWSKKPFSAKFGLRVVSVLATAAVGAMMVAGSALAAPGAKWSITSQAAPTFFAPGDTQDMYSLEAVTVGNTPAFTGQVTVTDELPAGVTPVEAISQLGVGGAAQTVQVEPVPCSIAGQVVTCTGDAANLESQGPLLPSEVLTFSVGVTVSVSPEVSGSLTNIARVEGGGYASGETTQTNLTSTAPVPPGVAYSHTELVNEDGSPALQAGSHPYELVTALRFNVGGVVPPLFPGETPKPTPAGAPKDVEVALPPGIVGNPLAGPRCPQRVFLTSNSQFSCPVATQIGIVSLRFFAEPGTAIPVRYPLYNIEPGGKQPAELGFSVSSVIHVPMLFSVRSNGDYGLTSQLRNISAGDPVESAIVSIWGVPGAAAHDPMRIGVLGGAGECAGTGCPEQPETSFLTTPSACSPALPAGITADFWQLPGANLPGGGPDLADPNWTSLESPFLDGVDGCGVLNLTTDAGSPGLDVHPNGTSTAGAPSGYDVNLTVPQEEDPHSNATPTLKNVSVTLPKGTVISASSAQGLGACSEGQIELQSAEPLKAGQCPDSSKLGTAEIFTPLLEKPLQGSLFLAQQGNAGLGQGSNPFGSLLAVYLEVAGSGVIVKLAGQVHLDQSSGQVTASFENNPQLPFNEIRVHLFDGARAALANPSSCGPAAGDVSLTPYSADTSTVVGGSQFEVTNCQPSKFSPSFKAGDTGSQRGGTYGPIVVSFGRSDSEQSLSGISTTLPEGLLARLAGVTECVEAQANAGSCPQSSMIGTTTASAGPGPNPITLPQPGQPADPVYLTGPYKGAALGLSVVTPAVAGPFNLGTVVVRASLAVDPFTSQVTATSDPLPTMLQGVLLDIRNVTLNIDRSSFTVNPTDCQAQGIKGTLTSTTGSTSAVSSPFQAVDCAALRFQPKVQLSLKGSTKHAGHPALKAVVTYPQQGAYANIARAQVNLPHSEFLDQSNLNKTCTKPVLLEGKCPKTSIYGKVKAWTPLLEKPLQGNVYLVGGFGYKLPALIAELNGQIRILLKGKVDSGPNKGIRNTFEAVPDAAVSRFVLAMKGGAKYSLLENSEPLCNKPQRAIARFTAQNGKVLQTNPLIANDCRKKSAGSEGR
jgi:hypothetical protein